ncbi:MAG: hypothetical protein KC419_27430 [Anaerolineales bacterium]|nr:hypothetical protein [Anaerolineales bacterium]
MKLKHAALLFIVSTLVALISWPRINVSAQEIVSENLFKNPGFEGGYYNQGSIAQIAVPNSWTMHWLDNVTFDGTEGLPAYRPETVVWYIQDAPEDERPLFFRDGSYTLKIFKGWAPMYAAISQDVSGLQVGRQYRIVAPIFIDLVSDYDGGEKVPPYRSDSGFVRFGVSQPGATWLDASQINYSPTWTAENVYPFYLTQQTFVWDFTAAAETQTVWIEMGSKHPYRNNGFFIDGVGLYALDTTGSVPSSGSSGSGAPVASGPTLTPFPTPTPRADGSIVHIVQSGDSMWTIAIQYAPSLGIPPEEALPLIQERNNNPTFVNVGQELIILPPGEAAPVVEEPTAEAEETQAEETATPVPEEAPAEETEAITEPPAEVAEVVPAETGGSADAPVAVAGNSVCVSVFNDVNSNGAQEIGNESLQADAAITLFRSGSTVSTYVTDGISEPFCFQDLEPDTYQVQVYPPADFAPTTTDNWAVSVSDGTALSVAFGVTANNEPAAVADAGNGETAVSDTAAAPAEEAPADSGGFFSSFGGIALVIAGILVLLAGAGVVMLRRG